MDNSKVLIFILLIVSVISEEIQNVTIIFRDEESLKLGDVCVSSLTNSSGMCVYPQNCNGFKSNSKATNICSFDGGNSVICCPKEDLKRKSQEKCEGYFKIKSMFKYRFLRSPQIDQNVPEVVGGEFTLPSEFPHMCAMGWEIDNKTVFSCGCSLISDWFVLTASHCWQKKDGVYPSLVKLGDDPIVDISYKGLPEAYDIEKFIKHPNYKKNSYYNDIALIKLKKRVLYRKHLQPACLWQNRSINETDLVVIGFGHTSFGGSGSNSLLKATLKIVKNEECDKNYGVDDGLKNGIVSSQLCAYHEEKDTCSGDSGGPAQIKINDMYHIVGVTSFGRFCAAGTPGVYTRVSEYLDFIESNVWGS